MDDVDYLDSPIHSKSDDLLNRSSFVTAAATAISARRSEGSIVVGLHGVWGAGKTSAFNLLAEHLCTQDSSWRVIRFSPWQWSDEQKLYDAFFDDVAVALGSRSRRSEDRLATLWRRYAARLKNVSLLSIQIPVAIKTAIFCVSLSLVGFSFAFHRFILFLFALLLLLSGFLKWTSSLLEQLAEALSPDAKNTRLSTEMLKHELSSALMNTDFRVLIAMDDLDRLSPDELMKAIQLIKGNADLPKLYYVFLGDHSILADHVNKALSVDGKLYLEKIIQVPLTLPHISQEQINKFYFTEIERLMADHSLSVSFDNSRWGEVFWSGVAPYLNTLRNVKRLTSTLELYISLVKSPTTFNLDLVDFLAIETLRVFNVRLYEAIRQNKAILTWEETYPGEDDGAKSKCLDDLTSLEEEVRRSSIRRLLKALFPAVGTTGQHQIPKSTQEKWLRLGRIASRTHFEAYFSLGFPDTEPTKTDVARIVKARDQPTLLLQQLQILSALGKLDAVIPRLIASIDEFDAIQLLICFYNFSMYATLFDPRKSRSSTSLLWPVLFSSRIFSCRSFNQKIVPQHFSRFLPKLKALAFR